MLHPFVNTLTSHIRKYILSHHTRSCKSRRENGANGKYLTVKKKKLYTSILIVFINLSL